MSSRILVTGASGYIGQAVVQHLVKQGRDVVAVARHFAPDCPAQYQVQADTTIPDAVRPAFEDVEAVVHLAAIPHPQLGTPFQVFTVNTASTFNVLTLAAEHGVQRVVLASSINATGVPNNPHGAMPAYFPIDENLPAVVGDAYSLSKQVDELSALMAHEAWGVDVVCLRYPFTAGEDRVELGMRAAREDPGRTIREGMSWLHVQDAASAATAAVDAQLSGVHVVGLAAHDTLRPEDSMELLARYAPGVLVTRELCGRESLVDTTRARELLGWTPRHTLTDRFQ